MDIVSRFEDAFCNAVIAKGDGLSSTDSELFEAMKDSYIRLRNHSRGLERIESLLDHDNFWVQSWVASQLLSEGEHSKAQETLRQLSSINGTVGFGAEITLGEYEKGSLGSPFGIEP